MKKAIKNPPLLQRKVVNGEQLKANPLFAKGKCIKKKRSLISISMVVRKITKSEEEEEEDDRVTDRGVVKTTPLKAANQKKLVGMYVDDPEVKRTLANWRLVKKVTQHNHEKIQNIREVARQNLEKIQNTAGLTDNMDAMNGFYELIGYSS